MLPWRRGVKKCMCLLRKVLCKVDGRGVCVCCCFHSKVRGKLRLNEEVRVLLFDWCGPRDRVMWSTSSWQVLQGLGFGVLQVKVCFWCEKANAVVGLVSALHSPNQILPQVGRKPEEDVWVPEDKVGNAILFMMLYVWGKYGFDALITNMCLDPRESAGNIFESWKKWNVLL